MAEVYYMNDRSSSIETSLVAKMLTLFDAAGFEKLVNPGDVVAIKLHMGEFNNTAYLRPVYVRALVEKIRSLGGDPMVVDTTTLPYWPFSSRVTALEYLKTVARNGFTQSTCGAPIVIADGFIGTDDVKVDLPEGYILQEQYIATGIALADSMIALTHFKGHPMGVFGGAMKNIGVGCASKRGKLCLHLGGHPRYGVKTRHWMPERCAKEECPDYQMCLNLCPVGAIEHTKDSILFHRDKCIGCLACIGVVTMCGVAFLPDDYFDATSAAITDSALAAVKAVGGPEKVGYINMALDISPWCDCVNFSDRPIVPNLGLFASWDPVAIDSACVQKARESAGMPDSLAMAKGAMDPGTPKFSTCGSFLGVSEEIQPNVGQIIGLGTRAYELIEVEPAADPTPYLCSQVPVGAKFGKVFAKKGDIMPPGGFKFKEEINLEDVREP
ncbi:MAG: DUF362 domain-containing protein [Deltaproteobacteria bacterium]|nr:DUF362 domain-containing protein [Deltaproteobacteria bacterium]MBW1922697.1 DUF362 domain-containing protein [Deltaproteobacteria bacterium]MBW1948139.1 DUF362 domain-containing protein [Deltaproteobacteria bacterium]MBW2009228.1 DUF362 domain-containing protein [Deltaproteobacteria bacterium]MBW2102518.1 DUF362 domain-containing protein [Deltaproteobacteria bacterium]